MTELMRHSGNFIEKRCEKCGSFVLQNLWGQKWCMSIRKCGWFDATITNNLPLPSPVKEDSKPKPKSVAKRKKK